MVNLMADKEHWEPVIKDLFEEDHATGSAVIKEAWAIDCQDHGESAVLNENELENGKRLISERSNNFVAILVLTRLFNQHAMNMGMRLSVSSVLVCWMGATNSCSWVTLRALIRGMSNNVCELTIVNL